MLCLEDRPKIREDAGMPEAVDPLKVTEPTLGEVFRAISRVEDSLGRFVAREVHETEMRGVNARLAKIEASNTWLARTVGAQAIALVAALVIFLITRGGA